MTQDEIIEMAKEAGWPDSLVAPIIMAKLHDFAKLVAAKERELCAQICEKQDWYGTGDYQFGYEHGVKNCVDAIRDLGE